MAQPDDFTLFSLADFFIEDENPLHHPPESFSQWYTQSLPYQKLMERKLQQATGRQTAIRYEQSTYNVLNLASLDYLGLCSHPDVIRAQQQALTHWGNGAGGVPLLSGTSELYTALERRLCELTGKDGAAIFTSGYAAAAGLCRGIFRKYDVAICDENAHVSWTDGLKIAGTKRVTFQHNSLESLEQNLRKYPDSRKAVIVDGLYSMDGDFAPLDSIATLCKKHNSTMIVDEAHSVFCTGRSGGGATEHFNVQEQTDFIMGTFSKALGLVGGFVAGPLETIRYIKLYANAFVFSSALPPALVAGILKAMDISLNGNDLREKLVNNASFFRSQAQQAGLDTGRSQSWIVPVILGSDRKRLFEGTLKLMQEGLYVAPVDFPAVPEDAIRLRVAVCAHHTVEDLSLAVKKLTDTFR